jgi:hypothetical protein
MTDEREKLRQECHEDLAALRADPATSERAYRLFEKLVARLDRLETGAFSTTERPTEPERRTSSASMQRVRKESGIGVFEGVTKALEEGKSPKKRE